MPCFVLEKKLFYQISNQSRLKKKRNYGIDE
ncbi:hypothetical protein WLH_00629 [Escherichia coli O25b:H4]|uniref:Uncharacterized protein n=1 Tax=Escherichia coli O25b:H4 TaxID=941280 RepID=A0A192C7L5_ECO25|nr:hypothetical protein WLH_00629 [Escherichia coli O25b:H4]